MLMGRLNRRKEKGTRICCNERRGGKLPGLEIKRSVETKQKSSGETTRNSFDWRTDPTMGKR